MQVLYTSEATIVSMTMTVEPNIHNYIDESDKLDHLRTLIQSMDFIDFAKLKLWIEPQLMTCNIGRVNSRFDWTISAGNQPFIIVNGSSAGAHMECSIIKIPIHGIGHIPKIINTFTVHQDDAVQGGISLSYILRYFLALE